MKKQLLQLLFVLNTCFLFAQSSEISTQSLDSVLSWMEQNYSLDSNGFHDIGLEAIERAAQGKDIRLKADLHRAMANWHGYHGLFANDSILHHDYAAIKYYQMLSDTSAIIDMYGSLSIDLINDGQFMEAQDIIFQSIDLCEKVNDEAGIAQAHRSLGALLDLLEKPEEGIRYSNMALDYYRSVEDHDLTSYTLLTLIELYTAVGDYPRAYEAASESIRIVHDLIPNQVFVLARAHAYRADVYIAEERYEEALKDAFEAWEIVKSQVGEERAQGWRSTIGDILRLQGQYEEALEHYLPCIQQLEESGEDRIYTLYQSIAECYEKLGDYQNSLKFERSYADIKNRMNEETIANLESEVIAKYESGKKDEALSNQQNQLAQKTKMQQLSTIALLVLLGLLSGLYYLLNKTKQVSRSLALKNEENEILLKEIHHRVKNNLQILSSLLSLQSDSAEDELIAGALRESKSRVESMGLIHQKLYSKDHLSSINMREYIEELCDKLEDSYNSDDRKVQIDRQVEIGLADVETAIPLGLIINELITNSMKYAFDDTQDGLIELKLFETKDEMLMLRVSDNGSKSVSVDEQQNSTSFGTRLIKILSKKLKGTIQVSQINGYQTAISFKRYQLV